MLQKIWLLAPILTFSCFTQANDCLPWFLQSGLVGKTKDCEIKCSVTPVDMTTFSCPEKCQELCEKTTAEQLLQYVPRLTEGDRLVISKMPLEALKVFLAKEKVDKLTIKIFKSPGRKDESDAFRHFLWSALLMQELGEEKAKIFLSAHEQDSTQSSDEKTMDEFNNEQGLSFLKEVEKKGEKPELDQIEKEALDRLKTKKLKVLNPKFKKIPGGYYSN